MLCKVTYRYTTDCNAVGEMSGTMLADPKRIIQDAERARRKRKMIRLIDSEAGTAHAFPADRLIDIRFEPATETEADRARP